MEFVNSTVKSMSVKMFEPTLVKSRMRINAIANLLMGLIILLLNIYTYPIQNARQKCFNIF